MIFVIAYLHVEKNTERTIRPIKTFKLNFKTLMGLGDRLSPSGGEIMLEANAVVDAVEHHLCCGLEAQTNELLFLEVAPNRVVASLVTLLTVPEVSRDPISIVSRVTLSITESHGLLELQDLFGGHTTTIVLQHGNSPQRTFGTNHSSHQRNQ